MPADEQHAAGPLCFAITPSGRGARRCRAARFPGIGVPSRHRVSSPGDLHQPEHGMEALQPALGTQHHGDHHALRVLRLEQLNG